MEKDTLLSQGKLLILERGAQYKTNRLHMKGLMNIYKWWSQWTIIIITPLFMQEM